MALTDAQLNDLVATNLPSGTGNPSTGAGIRAADHRDTLNELIGSKVSLTDGVPDGFFLKFKGPGNLDAGTDENGDAGFGYRSGILAVWKYEAGLWLALQTFE